jgi:hypothetical protein
MSTFMLIHGAWHGGWCWHRIVAQLEQRRMQASLPCQQRVTLDTDHSPFLSQPDELTAALLQLAS